MDTLPILPILPTLAVGSHATPGWLFLFRERMREGRLGPVDIEEAFADATRLAIGDQIAAGLDIVCDGELRRMRFVYEMYDRLSGLERAPPARRLGLPGYDRAPSFAATAQIAAPDGLGIVAEFEELRAACPDRPVKVAFPGPLTFANNIAPGTAYADIDGLIADTVAIVRAEIAALVAAGAPLIQIDEPGLTHPPRGLSFEAGAAAINAAIGGHDARMAVHVCFGNNASHPIAPRDLKPLYPAIADLDCKLLLLEFANREMADLEGLATLPHRFDIAAGVVDVKSHYCESADEVAARIAMVLRYLPAERLWPTLDCGLSALPRGLARRKLESLAAGAALARQRLA